ncbi:MAG: hypothetical protein HPZ91_03035 [Lentisphaeria bacterium]|nr:hypothetical protein [Lentisphaeria bacterium]
MIKSSIVFILCLFFTVRASENMICGPWHFTLNCQNGNLESVRYGNTPEFSAVRHFQDDGKETGEFLLKKYRFNRELRRLTLELEHEPWTLTEFIDFDAHGIPGLLGRSAELKLSETRREPAKFLSFSPVFLLKGDFDYYMPGTVFADPRHYTLYENSASPMLSQTRRMREGNTHDMVPGERLRSAFFSGNTILLQAAGTTFLFLNDDRSDPMLAYMFKNRQNGPLLVKQRIGAGGWAYPGEVQTGIGTTYLFCRPATAIPTALDVDLPRFFQAIGAGAPADRPDWAERSMVYEIAPWYGVEEDRLRRLAVELLPRIRWMNFNTLYLQPVQSGVHYYLPLFYEQLSSRVGTEPQFREFIEEVHRSGLRAWLDIVPHGSNLKNIQARGDSADWLCFQQNGTVSSLTYKIDYLNPGHRERMRSTAESYMKKFNLDGYRIDMPYGSDYNWARPGFPNADTPVKINQEWWRQSLEKLGGVLPKLPYQRASLPNRKGGFAMVDLIRSEARRAKPDASVLAEQLSPMNGVSSDLIYDLCYTYLTWPCCSLAPEQFVPELSRYFYERDRLSPPGTRYLRVFQTHDTPANFGFLGTAAGRCAYASCVLSKGSPVLDMGMDWGHGTFLSRLHGIRAAHPELSFGKIHYYGIRHDSPAVWCTLHVWQGQCAAALVNFSPAKKSGRLTIDPKLTELDPVKPYFLVNEMNGRLLASGTRDKLTSLEITLEPFESAILCFREKAPAVSTAAAGTKQKAASGKLELQRRADGPAEVRTDCYTLELDTRSGMISRFHNSNGKEILNGCDLVFARRLPADQPAELKIQEKADLIELEFRRRFGNAAATLRYRCFPDRIELLTTLDGAPGGEFAQLVFPVAKPEDGFFQVRTVDGLLDDSFGPLPLPTTEERYQENGRMYRDKMECVYDSETRPLDPVQAVAGCFDAEGDGFEVRVPDPLNTAPANVSILRRTGTRQSPALVLACRTPSVLTAGFPETFAVELRPAVYRAEPQSGIGSMLKHDGVTLAGESSGYRIENDEYILRLRRTGDIRELVRKQDGKLLLRNQNLDAAGVLQGKVAQPRLDPQTGCLIRRRGDALYFRFLSMFPYDRNRCWAIREYAFNKGGVISAAWHVMPDRPLALDVDWNAETPAGVGFLEGPGAVAVKENVATLPGVVSSKPSLPGHWQSFTLQLRAGKGTAPALPDCGYLTARRQSIQPDLSWEIFGVAFSTAERKMIPNRLMTQYPDLASTFAGLSGNQAFDRKEKAAGEVSVRLSGMRIDSRQLQFGSLAATAELGILEPGEYSLAFQMKTAGLCPDADVPILLGGIHDSGNLPRWELTRLHPSRDSEWTRYHVPFRIDRTLGAALLEIRQSDEWGAGKCWIDDIAVTRK